MDILQEAWFSLNRDDAERLLLKEPIGTYLFRKDSFAQLLQEVLRRSLKKSVHCYTLSYLDSEGIVRDHTIVHFNQTWLFYDDDPTLSGPSWNSIDELLKTIRSDAKFPLLHKKTFST